MVVLVVEDEVLIRVWVAEMLRERGLTVLEAGNADDAIDVLTAELEVRLVLTDHSMPGSKTGSELVAWIKVHRPEIITALTSSHSGLSAGDATLPKPFTPRKLVEFVGRLLARTA